MDCAKLENTVLVGDAMDLPVLLCYRTPKPKANCAKSRVWDINKTNDGLGSNVRLVVLFMHAILVVTLRQC